MDATIQTDGAIREAETDGRGRVTLGTEYANKKVKIAFEVIQE